METIVEASALAPFIQHGLLGLCGAQLACLIYLARKLIDMACGMTQAAERQSESVKQMERRLSEIVFLLSKEKTSMWRES